MGSFDDWRPTSHERLRSAARLADGLRGGDASGGSVGSDTISGADAGGSEFGDGSSSCVDHGPGVFMSSASTGLIYLSSVGAAACVTTGGAGGLVLTALCSADLVRHCTICRSCSSNVRMPV